MLEIKNVTLKVLDKELVSNLNLTLNDGEIHVLMGPNGVGKSSIASSIMGNPNYEVEGSIKYNGKEITVFASGMGMPSMGIYCYELYKFYDVEFPVLFGYIFIVVFIIFTVGIIVDTIFELLFEKPLIRIPIYSKICNRLENCFKLQSSKGDD